MNNIAIVDTLDTIKEGIEECLNANEPVDNSRLEEWANMLEDIINAIKGNL